MRIGVLFGGRSYEHEISVITAAEVCAALRSRAEVLPIYAREGDFFLVKEPFALDRFAQGKCRMKKIRFYRRKGKGVIASYLRKREIDCMVMCCHGGEGEDGTFSGLMELFDIPYTASAISASALTMDKKLSKSIFLKEGFPTPRAVFGACGEDLVERASALEYPLIVKPIHLGSSIGIAVAHDESELIEAIGVAFSFDEEILIEEVVEDAVELNCAAFLEEGKVIVSAVENPASWHEFLTFDDKYRGGKYKGGTNRIVEGTLAERVREETERIYRAFGMFGIARVDFLYSEKEDRLYVNEINSQPGSLAFYLFEEIGIDFPELLLRVVAEGRKRSGKKGIIKFDSGVLQNLSDFSRK